MVESKPTKRLIGYKIRGCMHAEIKKVPNDVNAAEGLKPRPKHGASQSLSNIFFFTSFFETPISFVICLYTSACIP